MKAAGTGIVYISHRLEELLEIASHVTVLRDGRLVAEAEAQCGPIDILIANAGGPPSTLFESTTEAQYQSALNLNLMAALGKQVSLEGLVDFVPRNRNVNVAAGTPSSVRS